MTEPFPSAPADDQPVPASGWRLGDRYRVTERLGVGGMAEVFRATDELLDRQVAVKVFRALHSTGESAESAERQRRELHALAQLNHPNLITLYDGSVGGEGGPAYLVMELVEGPTLAKRIASGPVPEPLTRVIGRQIADALAYVHAAGMVHRDVKPGNILIGTDQTTDDEATRARLSDFGVVRLLGGDDLTRADLTIGTATYLAPEQARGSAVGPPADVYALGLALLETLTGRRAYAGSALETITARLAASPDIPPGLPAPWPQLLRDMTALDPAARPSAAQVARALRSTTSVGPMPPVLAGAVVPAAAVAAEPAAEIAALAADDPAVVVASDPHLEPVARRRPAGAWLAAAAACVAIAGALLLALMKPGFSNDGTPAPAVQQNETIGTQAPHSTARTTGAADEQPAQPVQPVHQVSATDQHSAHPSTSASTSAPRSSSASTSPAPSSSSTAPASSPASTPTSAPPSTSGDPSPSASADQTSASSTAAAAPSAPGQ